MSDRATGYVAGVEETHGRRLLRAASVGRVEAYISPADGGELCSLLVNDTSGVHELLYRGNNWLPVDGWPGRGPWLWPSAGRSYAGNRPGGTPDPQTVFQWLHKDGVLPMPHHGFLRNRAWRHGPVCANAQHAEVSAEFQPGARDLDTYPYLYRIVSRVMVQEDTVTCEFRLTAGTGNKQPMPFTIGQHLTFDLSSWWGKNWLEGTLTGAGESVWCIDNLSLAGAEQRLASSQPVLLEPVLSDALIPASPGKTLSLFSPDGNKQLALSINVTTLPAEDAALWVTHRDPGGHFFCLEPWVGWPNGLTSGRGRVEVNPGDVWSMRVTIRMMSSDHHSRSAEEHRTRREVHIKSGIADTMQARRRHLAASNETSAEDS